MPVLHELTQGTSFYEPTCERIAGGDDWLICFWYKHTDGDGVWRYYCTTSADPEPPPPPEPGPPPPGFPGDFEDLSISIFPEAGTTSCWFILPPDPTEFFATGGVWGSWGRWFTGLGVGDLWVEMYPVSWAPGVVRWRCDLAVSGGGTVSKEVDTAAGFAPIFTFLPGEIPDCPLVRLAVYATIPP